MRLLQRNWRSFLVLSLFLGLAIYFRAFLIANIFEPIAVLFWLLWRIIASVHQNVYWTALILACLILMLRFIPFRGKPPVLEHSDDYSLSNRVEHWLVMMKIVSLGMDETEYLRDDLRRLLISIYKLERFSSVQPDEIVMPETVALPPAVQSFLFPAKGKRKMFTGNYRLQLLSLMPKWFRRGISKVLQTDNTAIEETLAWMESQMEINNGQ